MRVAIKARLLGIVGSVVVGSVLATAGAPTAAVGKPAEPRYSTQGTVDVCADGAPQCTEIVISQLQARFGPLGRACDHNALFGLTYLRTVETYEWAANQPGFFNDVAHVNHEDALFAQYYFSAYDAWAAGRRGEAPGAWLAAFDAGRDRRLNGAGDVLLGMNAHISHDLPFVLASIGLTRPDGTSRKPDHDKMNEVLARVVDPLLVELATRFDPFGVPTGLSPQFIKGLIANWREAAWQNAERLVAAPDAAARARVAAEIEATADDQARMYATLTRYFPPLTTTKKRDAHCAGHNGDAPPAYVFGTPQAYVG
jgi:hypothetical protein